MRLTIFGATGGTGLCLTEQALAGGHEVTVMVRNPVRLNLRHKNLRVMVGTIENRAEVEAAIQGADAVLSALGTRQRGAVNVCTEGSRRILEAMEAQGVGRLVAISAYGTAESHHQNLFNLILWSVLKEKMLDKEAMERSIRGSSVDWTLVRPPALTKGPRTGAYRFGEELRLGLGSSLSRADVAAFVLQHLTDPTLSRRAVTLAPVGSQREASA